MIPVFDGHNDVLLRMLNAPDRREAIWLTGEGKGHLDLPRMKAGGMTGGFFAIYIPSPAAGSLADTDRIMNTPPYDVPLPPLIGAAAAQPVAMAMAGHLLWMERTGTVKIVRSVAEIRDSMARGVMAAVMHMEGAEAIGADLDALHVWHAAGLRSLGPVWSRPTIFGHGVPFRFPSSPDTGEGLTAAGKDLVRECNRLRIMLDLSHLNENGFDDVAALSDAPLVATHSNAHAVTPASRNLTDRQLDAMAERGGLAGLNFGCGFVRADGVKNPDTPAADLIRHLDHLMAHLGEGGVALGSDFDGTMIPRFMGDAAGLPKLVGAMRDAGYGEALIRRLCWDNWLDLIHRAIG